ncbi:thiF family protein [Sarocladium implicatum]|nr:thiF family protein [Sarocladium implicatum]
METQNQPDQAAQPQQPQEQQTQPQQSNPGQDATGAMPSLDQTAIPQQLPLNPDGTYMNLDSNTVAGMMPDQMLQNPAMAGMGMADPSIMVPLMMPNAGVGLPPNGVSADDIALYDRQIRLWGVDAQARIQNANILLVNLRGLANEVAKNLVLAGVGSLTILDNAVVTEADLGAQFFLSEEDSPVGKNRAEAASPNIQKLNPRVRVHVDTEGATTKVPSYFAAFDVVIATDLDPTAFNLINIATRLNKKPFYAASTHGMYGFIFSDLIQHTYVIERDQGNVATEPKQETRTRSIVDVKTRKEGTKSIESVTKLELYSTWFLASDLANLPEDILKSKRRLRGVSPALSCLRALWEFSQINAGRLPSNREDLKMFTQIATQKHKALGLPTETLSSEFLRSFLQNLGSEVAPVTAILGGQLAQDVINVLGQKQQPIQNMVIFDGTTMEAAMYPLHPMDALGADQLSMETATMPGNGDAAMLQPGMDGMGGMGDMNGMMGMPMLNDPNANMAFANPMMMAPNMYAGDMGMAATMPDQSLFPTGIPQDASAQQQQQQPQQQVAPLAAPAEQPQTEAKTGESTAAPASSTAGNGESKTS